MASSTPTRARVTLLGFTFVLSLITFLDRVAIGAAAPAIRDELHLTAAQMGWVFSAFTFAYAAFEIPTGWLGDDFGPRKVLTRIVLWWSAFTMLTGAGVELRVARRRQVPVRRGGGGRVSRTSRGASRSWFPVRERGVAHGVVFMGSRVGGAIAPPLVVAVMAWFGWRAAFWLFGAHRRRLVRRLVAMVPR